VHPSRRHSAGRRAGDEDGAATSAAGPAGRARAVDTGQTVVSQQLRTPLATIIAVLGMERPTSPADCARAPSTFRPCRGRRGACAFLKPSPPAPGAALSTLLPPPCRRHHAPRTTIVSISSTQHARITATMFRDFSFAPASPPSIAIYEAERAAMNVSPTSKPDTREHYLSRPSTPPCTIGDLASQLNQQSLRIDTSVSNRCSGPLTPPSEDDDRRLVPRALHHAQRTPASPPRSSACSASQARACSAARRTSATFPGWCR
jgi:hypothetical protein